MKELFLSILIGVSITPCAFGALGSEIHVIAMIKEANQVQQAIIKSIPECYDETNTTCEPNDRIFTLEELKKYNGQNGKPGYIAVDGIVYDTTNSKRWKNGRHCNVSAGNDLSKEIGTSPHGKETLKKLPMIGVLK